MSKQIPLPPKYPVPPNWKWVEMNHLVFMLTGFPFDSKKFSTDPFGRKPLIRIRNVVSGKTTTFTDEPCPNEYIIHKGDILIGMDGDFNVAKWKSENALLNQRVCYIRSASKALLNDYLFYYLAEPLKLINAVTPSVTVKHLSTKTLEKTSIPLAPLDEQQRIIDRIESLFAKLDEAKEKAQDVIDGFDDRRSSILSKAFSGELTEEWRKNHSFDAQALYQKIQTHLSTIKRKKQKKVHNNQKELLQAKIPKEWLLIDLDSISTQITDGEHKTPNRVQSFCGYYLLSARNVYNDSLRLDDVDYIDSEEYHRISKRCNPQKGDILISCSGSVGRSCVVSDDNKYCMVRSAAMISQKGCNPRFIMYMLQSEPGQKQIKQLSKQTAQANLFLGAIASLVIPLPSKEEQDIVVERLDVILKKLNSAKETAEQVIEQIEVIKKAILARAFRGELGTNDPNDESAVDLLRRVINS